LVRGQRNSCWSRGHRFCDDISFYHSSLQRSIFRRSSRIWTTFIIRNNSKQFLNKRWCFYRQSTYE
jgi:hypothetical protein